MTNNSPRSSPGGKPEYSEPEKVEVEVLNLAWDLPSYVGGGERAAIAFTNASRRYVTRCELAIVSSARQVASVEGLPVSVIRRVWGPFDNPLPDLRALRAELGQYQIIHVHQANTLLLDFAQVFKTKSQRLVVTDYGGAGISFSRLFRYWGRIDAATIYTRTVAKPTAGRARQVYVPMPIDVNRFPMLKGEGRVAKSVLSVGRILPHKGFDVLIEAIPSGFTLTVFGRPYDQEYFAFLKALARQKQVDVRFVTDGSDKDLVRELNRCAVFVSASVHRDYRGRSVKNTELFGIAALEAAACGCPVIVSSAVPGLQEGILAEELYRAVYPWDDPVSLRRAIRRWATTVGYIQNREYVSSHHSEEAAGYALSSLYSDLIGYDRQL